MRKKELDIKTINKYRINYLEDISIKGESYKISKIIFVLYNSKLSSNSVAITILINEYLQNFDVIISKYVIY